MLEKGLGMGRGWVCGAREAPAGRQLAVMRIQTALTRGEMEAGEAGRRLGSGEPF